jgi:malonyl-CoA/methylmalonyl-CoA synthetase
MLLPLLDTSLVGRAHETGLEWRGETLTFGAIDVASSRLAHELGSRGLTRGDRLALWLPNRPEVVTLVLACLKAGVIAVPINILYREREAGHILGDARPRAVVVEDAPPAPGFEAWTVDALVAASAFRLGERPANPPTGADPAALIYTSGTTGAAKGAVLTHGNFAANASTLVDAWRFTAADRLLVALPLFHVHGLGNAVMCWLASGCLARLLPRFDHRTAADELLDFRPTVFFGVPTMYVRLLEVAEDAARRIGGRARLFVSGSAPLSSHTHEAFERRFGHRILERYGMTETLMTLGNPYDGERRAGTVGLPLPGVAIRIVDADGGDVAAGDVGELRVQSATVCAGYWNRPEASAAAFANGWFRTGDLASRAADGYVTLHGRQTDLIISGGFNVYPREIEDVLGGHPSVAEVAVAGAPDPARGEVPIAFVVPSRADAWDPEALEALCRSELASFKVPRAFVAVDSLPRTALGKVQKKQLLEAWGTSPPGRSGADV